MSEQMVKSRPDQCDKRAIDGCGETSLSNDSDNDSNEGRGYRGTLRRDRHAHDRAAPRDRARACGRNRSSRRGRALPPLRRRRRQDLDFDGYRTVKLFEDAGIIERHDFREGRARYEQMRETHHDHLINLRDGKVIEFTSDEIEKLQSEVARKLGYKLVDHRLELYCVPLEDDKA